jgi:hypothetical protein
MKPTSKLLKKRPMPIRTPCHAESDFFGGALSFVGATLDTGATDGAGAALELVSAATTAPHSGQNRAPGTNGLPHIMQKVLIVSSS